MSLKPQDAIGRLGCPQEKDAQQPLGFGLHRVPALQQLVPDQSPSGTQRVQGHDAFPWLPQKPAPGLGLGAGGMFGRWPGRCLSSRHRGLRAGRCTAEWSLWG